MRHFKKPGISRKKQSGAVLLAVMLLLTMILAHTILSNAHVRHFQSKRDEVTMQALAEAKAALIGRAVSDNNRPGSLRCPDITGDGKLNLNEDYGSSGCFGFIGFFPWYTLKLSESEDGWNAPLWYALSQNFMDHSSSEPLNSETTGLLSVDGTSDIVAVIFAPGRLLTGQNRTGSTAVADYLEGANADGDDIYTEITSDILNDRLIFITRQELMQAVEWRVAGEFAIIMKKYKSDYDYYPWLSEPLESPDTSLFLAESGKRQGRIPYDAEGEPFYTDLTVIWKNLNRSDILMGTDDLLDISDTDKDVYNVTFTIPVANTTTCTRSGTSYTCSAATLHSEDISLSSSDLNGPPPWAGGSGGSGGFTITRTFTLNSMSYTYTSDLISELTEAQATDVAKYTFTSTGPGTLTFNVTIKEYNDSGTLIGEGTVDFPTTGGGEIFSVGDIRANMQVSDWLIKNNWHHIILAAFSAGYEPGGPALCTTDCLTVNLPNGLTIIDAQAIAISASAPVGANPRPSANLTDYLEDADNWNEFDGDPLTEDNVFSQSFLTSSYNDRIRIVE